MQTQRTTGLLGLAFCAAMVGIAFQTLAVIESNFDDLVYPGEAGNGWTGAWQHSVGTPEIRTENPIDGNTPYIRLDATGATIRNFMRQFEASEGVNVAAPHYIRWKFRLNEADFDANFSVFNDRIHFFGRTAPRLTGSVDNSINWFVLAAGAPHSSGAGGGKTFWVFDHVDGTLAFNTENLVDTQVVLVPGDIYSFEVLVDPEELNYTVSISNETSGASFKSDAPHRFRNLTAVGSAHTYLHFGVQASAAAELRAFDLDSVSISSWDGPTFENVTPNAYAIHNAAEGIQFDVVALDPVAEGNIGLTLNGANVSAQLTITGAETNRHVSYAGLVTNTIYEMVLTATNALGTATLTRTFYTATEAFVLYDSEGFTSDQLYPVGPLQPVTHGRATWQPHMAEPSEIRDDFEDGKVLDRENWLDPRADWLHLPPLASGTVVVEFDAKVSRADTRTFDVSLMPVNDGAMSSMLGWGVISDHVAYFDGSQWQPLMDLDVEWHHYRIVHYLSGPGAGFYDVVVDGTPVAERLSWRDQIGEATPFGRFRLHSHQDGELFEFGRIDNLVITGGPEAPEAFPPPTIVIVRPFEGIIHPRDGLLFEVISDPEISGSDITLLLNGENVSDDLDISGSPNHLIVSYDQLEAEINYEGEIRATNPVGTTSATFTFIATEQAWLVHPADSWADGWQYPGEIPPQILTDDPIDGTTPYLRFNTTGSTGRNLMRHYESSTGVDISRPHSIRWKFRLPEDAFDDQFTVFNDRVHFFALHTPRLTASTDWPITWGIMATGATHGSGAAAGQTFWVYDRTDDIGGFNPENLVDSGVALRPHHVFAFEILVFPEDQTYSVVIVDETSGASFTSSAPYSFRAGGVNDSGPPVTATSHTFLHFGVNASSATQPRAFDLDSVFISSAVPTGVVLLNPVFADGVFSFSFQTEDGVIYTVLVTDNLMSGEWTMLTTVSGDGEVQSVADPNPSDNQRYYRVRTD